MILTVKNGNTITGTRVIPFLTKALYQYLQLLVSLPPLMTLLQKDKQDLKGSDRELCLKLDPAAVFRFRVRVSVYYASCPLHLPDLLLWADRLLEY